MEPPSFQTQWRIQPSLLQGALTIPPSKSHTMRALIFAALAKGKSVIHNFLPSPDTFSMIQALSELGARFQLHSSSIQVWGTGGKVYSPSDVIQCGNSGQILRFIGALTSLQSHYAVLTGDHSIRNHRPIQPLIEGLTQWGAFATSSLEDGTAPLIIRGPLLGKEATIRGEDSQPVSGLLIAAAFAPISLHLNVRSPGEKPWIQLTLYWLDKLGISYTNEQFCHYALRGLAEYDGFEFSIPGDYSSAAFPIAAALLTRSPLILKGLCRKDPQGDKVFIEILIQLGAQIEWRGSDLYILPSDSLRGGKIDANDCIDAVPILALLGCFGSSPLEISNVQIARHKESDRLASVTRELTKMGAHIVETPDSLVIYPSPLRSSRSLCAHKDHRIALTLAVGALATEGESILQDVGCVEKSYPSFSSDFRTLGAKFFEETK